MRTWADWGPHLSYWVENGKPDPDVDWPENWEVCGVPDRNPLVIRDEDKQEGQTTLAWAMYHVSDPVEEIELICSFLERMPETEFQKWLALPDRQLSFNCSDSEMDAADMNARGFAIPGALLQRVRRLRLRLMIGFHPGAEVIRSVVY